MTQSRSPQRQTQRLKMVLPMIIHGSTVVAAVDTGSEDNVIASKVVADLGLTIEDAPEHQKEFRTGNNRIVKALGRVRTYCTFAKDQGELMPCSFWVFQTLITPLIMGMAFLIQTETMTRNRHRLQQRCQTAGRPLICASLDNQKRRLHCSISVPLTGRDRYNEDLPRAAAVPVLALADTGSELDLISIDCCQRLGLLSHAESSEDIFVQFADGSIAALSGRVDLQVSPGNLLSSTRTFYILNDMTCDLILGEDFLYQLDAFESYKELFSIIEDNGPSNINTIVWLTKLERLWFKKARSDSSDASQATSDHAHTEGYLKFIDTLDAQENRRREEADNVISRTPVAQRAAAHAREEAQRAIFDRIRRTRVAVMDRLGTFSGNSNAINTEGDGSST
ncbi:uncharacterized protein PAC_05912 [Phialocephala subalpina]|uniref:Peptidase A2 domain-containing protein n=1 Tax=Phialocephala subalpina TaxID=576137 RepID=A0A1L7WTC2_9HELO|nr:uncharacterized protein PAC_05912 [Phialocephala subalpina]